MGFLQRIFGTKTSAKPRAEVVYREIMAQSRSKNFFGDGRFPDSYDGRLDVLTLHMAIYMDAVRKGEAVSGRDLDAGHAESFSQSVFDVMVKDFDTALREEGYTDTGVKKRIKPIIGVFYKRLKTLTESLGDKEKMLMAVQDGPIGNQSTEFAGEVTDYLDNCHKKLSGRALDSLVNDDLSFPNF